jgi:putative DNA primase/helicase
MSHDLRSVARKLGGEVAGRQVVCPGPGHSRTDRSLAVRLDPGAPDGFLTHSFTNDDWQTCRDHVRTLLGLPQWEPGDEQNRSIPAAYVRKWDFGVVDAESDTELAVEHDPEKVERDKTIWREAVSPIWSPAEDYLASRKLDLPTELAERVLRFHPECPWRNENTGQIDRIPCLLAAFRSFRDGSFVTFHRIRLDRPQHWPKTERKFYGPVTGAAIKLAPATDKLTIGEGVETCMAATQLGLGPACWALGSVGRISKFPVLDGIDELTILAEAGKTSAEAVKFCAQRWRRAGRRVIISRSTIGSDHNDALMMRVAS